jgi:hypothetical protein
MEWLYQMQVESFEPPRDLFSRLAVVDFGEHLQIFVSADPRERQHVHPASEERQRRGAGIMET